MYGSLFLHVLQPVLTLDTQTLQVTFEAEKVERNGYRNLFEIPEIDMQEFYQGYYEDYENPQVVRPFFDMSQNGIGGTYTTPYDKVYCKVPDNLSPTLIGTSLRVNIINVPVRVSFQLQ